MAQFLRHLRNAIRHLRTEIEEARSEKRDRELLKVFLGSPAERGKALGNMASPSTKLFLAVLMQFALSELETSEVRLRQTLSTAFGDDSLPSSISTQWLALLVWAFEMCTPSAGYVVKCDFVTEAGPIPIFITICALCTDFVPGDDIGENIKKLSENDGKYILSKIQPA